MNTTFLKDKNGKVSSTRTTFGSGNNKISFTRYSNGTNGGVTIRNRYSVVRIDNKGNTLGHGIRMENKMTYFDKHGGISSNIPSFI